MKCMLRVILAACLLSAMMLSVGAADTMYDAAYCFSASDFGEEDELRGVFLTQMPGEEVARIRLGDRELRPGDVLPVSALGQLQLVPCCTENQTAELRYRPILGKRLGEAKAVTVSIRSGKNDAPKAENARLETYKNIPNNGCVTASDPEGGEVTYRLLDAPKRGTVELKTDGSFLYTPSKNKVGEDSFTFVATDEAGNESQPAKVDIRILKPKEAKTFADLEGDPRAFEAMWSAEAGLCSGRTVGSALCFEPLASVSRGEFLVMAMEQQKMEIDEAVTVSGFADAQEAGAWMQPYLAAAMRSGAVSGSVDGRGLVFRPNDPITRQEAAVMLQNMLGLPVPVTAMRTDAAAWAASSLQALAEAGVPMGGEPAGKLTRIEAAGLLYRVDQLQAQSEGKTDGRSAAADVQIG